MKNEVPRKCHDVQRVVWCVVLCIAPWLNSCVQVSEKDHVVLVAGHTMGTTYSVKVRRVPDRLTVSDLRDGIEQILERINDRMSTYRDDSELTTFNRSKKTDWVTVSGEMVRVMTEALRVGDLTNGAFDVTVAPSVDLWGFGPTTQPDGIPSNEAIRAALRTIGYHHVHIRDSPPAIRKDHPVLQIDLSAIAKGYAVDQVAEYLESVGIPDYLVDIGGELRAKGRKDKDTPWKVAIERPDPGGRAMLRVLALQDRAMATSGDYRNFFEEKGQRFSHTINPRTGRPVTHQLASVTVLSDSCMEADALATGFMVLGMDEGYALANREKLAALFVTRTSNGFEETATPAFEPFLIN